MTPEGRIKAKFSAGLKAIQARHPGKLMVRMPVLRGMGAPLLDYLLCANGNFVLVETKKDADTDLTPQQKATRREAINAGGWVYVVNDDVSSQDALIAIEALVLCDDHCSSLQA